MADQRISNLTTLTSAGATDLFAIVDVGASQTKKITFSAVKSSLNLVKADVGLSNVDNTSDVNKPLSTATQNELNIKQGTITAFNKAILHQASPTAGDVQGVPDWQVGAQGGLTQTMVQTADNGGSKQINNYNANIKNDVSSPDESYILQANNFNIDINDQGFSLGTNGRAATFYNNNLNALNKASIGELVFSNNSFTIGNGTDPISARGVSYSYGFGSFRDNVNVNGPLQGYGFQPNFESGATFDSSQFVSAFYDATFSVDTIFGLYTSFSASPTLGGIATNNNYTGFNLNPNIEDFQGNSGFTGIGVFGSLGELGTNGYQGIVINTNIDDADSATGLSISNNITTNQNYTGINVDTSNVNSSGNKLAGNFNGNVNINGSLGFSGALSVGEFNAFVQKNAFDGGGQPLPMHGLITAMIAPNGSTTANADAIGVNTAMLITLEEDSTTTSGPFGLGFTAMALPCVVRTETNSVLDNMSGTTAAISLDGTSTGGEVDTIKCMRSVAIPNGITQVNKLRGFQFDLPFGDPANTTHGFYTAVDCDNYFRGGLVIGESSEVRANSSVGLEVSSATKAILNSRMTTTQRNALTAVNGMQIYNITDDKLQVYAAGSWVDLH